MTRSGHIREITAFLEGAGASNVHVEEGGKHPRVVYTWRGRERFYVVPHTPGDCGSFHAAIRDLRHALGLIKTTARTGERRRRKAKATGPRAECPVITALPDWREPLRALAR